MNGLTHHEAEIARDDHGVTAGILTQLADAVKAMQAAPAVRLSGWHRIEIQHNADTVAEVDAIAAGIGAVPEWNKARTHYQAVRLYGPNVAYSAVFITDAHMKAHSEHWAAFPREDGAGTLPELAGTGVAA